MALSAMRRLVLVVVALAACTALLVIAWPDEPARATPRAAARSAAVPRATRAVISEPGVAAEPDELAAVEHAEATVQALGRACWERRTPHATPPRQRDETTQSLRLDLRITVAAGEARVALVAVTDDQMLDPALRSCIVDGVTALRWPSERPDGGADLRTVLRMGRYTTPQGPPARPPRADPTRVPLASPPPAPGPPGR